MEDAFELADYLPLSFKTPSEQEYVAFLWDAFETNYQAGKYQFAFLAYHMLTMSFVYFIIWQIREIKPRDFEKATIGFDKKSENVLAKAINPFTFGEVSERSILRILKLIDCDKGKIGTYSKLVDDRNNTAHANGNIFYNNQTSLDDKITKIIRVVKEIQDHSTSVIQHCYQNFLTESQCEEEREYPDPKDQIREILIHDHYLSQRDIEICLNFNIDTLRKETGINQIETLHKSLCEDYGVDEEDE